MHPFALMWASRLLYTRCDPVADVPGQGDAGLNGHER